MPTPRILMILPLLAAMLSPGATPAPHITSPKEALGFNIGDDYQVANYTQLETYWKKLAAESPRMKLVDIGRTAEGRPQYMAIITSPENQKNLAKYQSISRRLALAEGVSEEQAHTAARTGKAVIWIDGGLHANETVGSQQLIETVYQLVSRTDPETLRILNDDIVLCVIANPDGQEMVADWYMREKDPLKRSLANLPKLYNKYVGHDDNRDFYMSNMPETTNMNRQMFLEWFPQIVYDHHQTGPAGAVIFMPPFRDPFNYNFDPLIPLGIEMVGTAMHERLVAEGKGGSAMRSGANYSTWWNGGLRTITYFHNMIGLLTEIIGNPTPIDIPLVPEKQLPQGDWPLPVAPGKWHYRQSIDYDVTNNYSVLDLASRYRETFLFNIWRMGTNSIEKGSHDSWTVTPKRIEALKAAAPAKGPLPEALYTTVLHDPAFRDARGYILPADQPDFPTAVKFANTLIKNGVSVLRAGAAFTVNGRSYPSGSLVVKTAQAFRPHILDMFEPQDHPNDFKYPGGPPAQPYDITGWTLALQMGVQFDRVLDGFDGPFTKVDSLLTPPPTQITAIPGAAGWMLSHQQNDSFIATNRLLKAGSDVYWMRPTGDIWVPASPVAAKIVSDAARQLGISVRPLATTPPGEGTRLKPIRIGLFDQPGGLITSGWTRWLLEQFEFPFEVVTPETLSAGSLNSKFDVLLFTDGATERRVPAAPVKQFVEAGGTAVLIGGATRLSGSFGAPVKNIVADLPAEKFFIPGSLLTAEVDTTNPLAWGLPAKVDVFFDRSPVFRTEHPVAWFGPGDPLASGWAWGSNYLKGGAAIAEQSSGRGKLVLIGPEIAFRAQSHGTFRFLFNALYYGSAQPATPASNPSQALRR